MSVNPTSPVTAAKGIIKFSIFSGKTPRPQTEAATIPQAEAPRKPPADKPNASFIVL